MKIIKSIWIVVSIIILVVTLYGFDGEPNSDIGIFFAWSMVFLTFPSGLLVSLVHMIVYEYFSITIDASYFSLLIDWAGFFILGYVQWFVLLPFLWRKIKP